MVGRTSNYLFNGLWTPRLQFIDCITSFFEEANLARSIWFADQPWWHFCKNKMDTLICDSLKWMLSRFLCPICVTSIFVSSFSSLKDWTISHKRPGWCAENHPTNPYYNHLVDTPGHPRFQRPKWKSSPVPKSPNLKQITMGWSIIHQLGFSARKQNYKPTMQLFGHWTICFLDLLQQIPCNWVSAVMTFSAGNPAFANGPGGESWIFHDLSGCRSKLGIIKLSLMHQFPTELNHLMHLGRIWGGAWCWIHTVCIFFR